MTESTAISPEELLARAAAAKARAAFPIPESAGALLNRRDLAAALTAAGYEVSPATLATKASRGGGPPFRRFGRVPLYSWGDGLAWAQARLSALISNTSGAA
jgi:hypothetical protein